MSPDPVFLNLLTSGLWLLTVSFFEGPSRWTEQKECFGNLSGSDVRVL